MTPTLIESLIGVKTEDFRALASSDPAQIKERLAKFGEELRRFEGVLVLKVSGGEGASQDKPTGSPAAATTTTTNSISSQTPVIMAREVPTSEDGEKLLQLVIRNIPEAFLPAPYPWESNKVIYIDDDD